jgi:hypothetical protein
MASIALESYQKELRESFKEGARVKLGNVIGGLVGAVAEFHPTTELDPTRIKTFMDGDATAVVKAIMANRHDGATLQMIRHQMIGAALLNDREAVVRWATEGANRCERAGNSWAETVDQWRWVLGKPDVFITYARQVKAFTNQL